MDAYLEMIPPSWLVEAEERISAYIHQTPLTYDRTLDIYLKWENQQITGSFKARGALNKVLSLQDWERDKGLVAASAGNHGQGVALAGSILDTQVTVFVPEHAVPAKVHAMQSLGATVLFVSGGYHAAEAAGKTFAIERKMAWISPYNDGQVIAGQGTLGLETMQQLPALPNAAWLVPVGGGGLISGIGAAIKGPASHFGTPLPNVHLVGVQSEASPFLHGIFYQGSQDHHLELPSLADGLAGPVETNSITIPLVRQYVDEMILVNEDQIKDAIRFAWKQYHETIEGSAAAPLAAILSGKIKRKPLVVVISGGNIQPEVHQAVVSKEYLE